MDRTTFKSEVAIAIRTEREAKGMSQTELANRARLKPSHISHFESGRRTTDLYNLWALAKAMKIPAKKLLPIA